MAEQATSSSGYGLGIIAWTLIASLVGFVTYRINLAEGAQEATALTEALWMGAYVFGGGMCLVPSIILVFALGLIVAGGGITGVAAWLEGKKMGYKARK